MSEQQPAILNKTLRDYLSEMIDPRGEALLAIYEYYEDVIHYASGSSHNHQAWQGGYADHIAETFRISELYYDAMNAVRPLPYTKDEALIALFFHDLEKPFRYGPEDSVVCNAWRNEVTRVMDDVAVGNVPPKKEYDIWEDIKWNIITDLEASFGFKLTDDERNAIEYAHGEGSAHEKFQRVASPLASHVHICDTASARIWHDEGQGLSRKMAKPKTP